MLADSVIHLSYPLAFAAGLISFLSPCVLPLLPAYLAYLGGRAGAPAADPAAASVAPGPGAAVPTVPRAAGDRAPLVANGVAFVAGFTAVFVLVFYVFAALGVTLFVHHRRTVEVVAGVFVALLGLQTLGLLRIRLLMRDTRRLRPPRPAGLLGAFLLGVTFAAGWSPCIGPQLGLILSVAGERDFGGLPVMLVYAAGLAIPFLLAALLADRAQGAVRALNKHLRMVNLVAGAVLIVFGLLLAAGNLTTLNRFGAPIDV